MAAYSFPLLSSAELASVLHEILGETFSEEDFKNPQSTKIQKLYATFLQRLINTPMDKINQPQWEASQGVLHPELYSDTFPLMNLTLAMQRFMVGCLVKDFKMKDILHPKPKRTRRFLSAIINFWRFSVEREDVYYNICQEIQGSLAERSACQERITQIKEKINLIRMNRAEEEEHAKQLQDNIDESDAKMMSQQQDQAGLQRDISRLRTTVAEKAALVDKHKLSILNKQEMVSKMQAQVVQSPERMKADISRMHSTLASRKETKKEKGHRLQEMRGQNENCQLLLQSSEQGDSMITAINTELEKQREAQATMEGVRDQIQIEKDQLRDFTAQEGHLNRQRESKQEKLVKLQLQHQHTVTALQENIQREQRELEECCQKQEKKLGHVQVLIEQKNNIKKKMSDEENIHGEEMSKKKEKYEHLLVALDSYHKDLSVGWEQADPR
ncbi:kinetochore protein Nuf2-A [Strongylocentrotus purpuratus]|uniref:Kinetochore protein Nuf2 N-terminal domain-containing protein n=1 Tax=Strongylocentrotus purpuratus TaxID=7668 RepID=A0A7M7NQK4_STRPU|nr:kinetochore protein Nuf2-A [Strongylocentrotus purpuratus]XP_030840053.1 kinetochore protein Nuf2-A [Strongylocentrotus purpuratus]|eukprot:XP_011672753.1 PREDICTED: kinetochore protein Nuf2-A isoform X1 [Strongylocentrotus purpuratus]